MHKRLILLSVIMILSFVTCSDVGNVQDLSDWCASGRKIDYHLTSGAGSSDKSVSKIASNDTNCTLKFSVNANNYIMVVLEFPDKKPHERVCYTQQNTSVTISDFSESKSCQSEGTKNMYHSLSSENMAVNIRSSRNLNSVKIIATSMRDAGQVKCSPKNETECIFGEKLFCMTSLTLCDGHNNCGLEIPMDEDRDMCGAKLTFFVVITSIVMLLLTLSLLLAILTCLIPKRKDPYIHNFDPNRALFDCENGITSADIRILILFADHSPEEQVKNEVSKGNKREGR